MIVTLGMPVEVVHRTDAGETAMQGVVTFIAGDVLTVEIRTGRMPTRLGLPPYDGVAEWSWRLIGGAPDIVPAAAEDQGESSAETAV